MPLVSRLNNAYLGRKQSFFPLIGAALAVVVTGYLELSSGVQAGRSLALDGRLIGLQNAITYCESAASSNQSGCAKELRQHLQTIRNLSSSFSELGGLSRLHEVANPLLQILESSEGIDAEAPSIGSAAAQTESGKLPTTELRLEIMSGLRAVEAASESAKRR